MWRVVAFFVFLICTSYGCKDGPSDKNEAMANDPILGTWSFMASELTFHSNGTVTKPSVQKTYKRCKQDGVDIDEKTSTWEKRERGGYVMHEYKLSSEESGGKMTECEYHRLTSTAKIDGSELVFMIGDTEVVRFHRVK